MTVRDRPYIIGLTGSIGMGKSTVAQMFADENVPLFDADAAVHQLQGPGGALVDAIESMFPVGEMRLAFLQDNEDQPMVLFDIPLLFEKSGADGIDHIVVVSASAEDQRARVLARPGMTEERFEQIKSLQMPDAEKRKRADSVIDTSLPLAETRQQVQKLVQKLKASLA